MDFVDIVAEIITGEAEVLGVVGMTTVAGCIATQTEHGWTPERIAASWTARKAAGPVAYYLAQQVVRGEVWPNGFECCLSLADTIKLGCGNGEIIVARRGTPYELHLWREYPKGSKE
jgi:hypothetical protein